jgi:hypothetical protein
MADILIFQKDTNGCFVYWPFHAPVHAPAMDSLPEAGSLGLHHN